MKKNEWSLYMGGIGAAAIFLLCKRLCLSLSHTPQVVFSLSFFCRPMTVLTLACTFLPILIVIPKNRVAFSKTMTN